MFSLFFTVINLLVIDILDLYVKIFNVILVYAEVAELGDAVDSKSTGVDAPCGFESRPRHQKMGADVGSQTFI